MTQLRVDKKHSNCCFKNSETTPVPPIAAMIKTLSNVRNLSIVRNFQCYETFRGWIYIVLLETFLENTFLNAPSYWGVADSAQIEEHCLIVIESSEISWRSQCTLRESQIQSHKAGRGLKVEYRLYDRDMVLQNGLRPQLRGSRERNAIPDFDGTSQFHYPVMHKDEIWWDLLKSKSFLGRFVVLIQEVFFYFLEPHSS